MCSTWEKVYQAVAAATAQGRYCSFSRGYANNPNKLAERTVRPFVSARKISGGSRSPAGSAIRCDLTTLFHTWAARGHNHFTACVDALQTR